MANDKATWDKFPPDIDALPSGEIIDVMGLIQSERKRLKDLQDKLQDYLLARGMRPGTCGSYFKASPVEANIQWTLDRAALEEEMGKAWVFQRCKPKSISAYIAITPLSGAVAELVRAAAK